MSDKLNEMNKPPKSVISEPVERELADDSSYVKDSLFSASFMNENKALMISIALHAVVVVLLVVSVSFSPKATVSFASQAPAQPIQAVFIDAQAIADQKRQQAQAEAAARQKALEKQRQQEQQAAAERERKRKAEAAAKKKREEQALKEKQAQERAEAERQRTLEEQRKREAEMQRKLEEEKQRQAQQQREMEEQLAQEQAALNAANQRRVMSEVEKYQALIHQTIVQNLFDFESFVGRTCRLNVRLAPDGLVIDVRVLDGNDALCRASSAAVLRPATLPMSKDPAVYAEFRDFNITVSPEL
uniref:cell envelope integrity protein TolA n=1 Tax=Ningiella ruwaisensis TaxID=2364274 RepID=UPI00109F7738|nr:cell envelope integrity protein TolA [Ningiella ruwaisensis]